MAETPNHGYNVPEEGEKNWHEPLNDNVEAFEVDIEIRDEGEPGDNGYDPTAGSKYLDTASGTVYLGDGSDWEVAFSFETGNGTSGEILTDTAYTFSESGVTVEHQHTEVASNRLRMADIPDEEKIATRPADTTSMTEVGKYGLVIEPKVDLEWVTVQISENTSGESTVYLTDRASNVLTSEPSPGAGNSTVLRYSMSAGTEYEVVVDNGDDEYTHGRRSGIDNTDFPFTSEEVDIVAGTTPSSIQYTIAYAISEVSTVVPPDGRVASRPSDTTSLTEVGKYGLVIEPRVDLRALGVTVSENTSGESTVYLTDRASNVLTSESSPGAGNSTTLYYPMSAGTEYEVVVDNGDDEYTHGRRTGIDNTDFPFKSIDIDIVAGTTPSTMQYTIAYAISEVETFSWGTKESATATVEWDEPSSISQWESATFQHGSAGGTVEVFVEVDDGDGWEDWQPEPIGPGTNLSAISPDANVRFRLELSRFVSADDPAVTLLTRQWRS